MSTTLAILGILPSRPRFHVEPGDLPICDLTVRVVNPTKRMRFVKELWRIRFRGSEKALGVYTDKTRMVNVGKPGALWLAIKSEREATLMVNCIVDRKTGQNNRWLVILGWQGSWIVPWLWVPVPVYVSARRADRLKAAN